MPFFVAKAEPPKPKAETNGELSHNDIIQQNREKMKQKFGSPNAKKNNKV